MSFSVVWYVFLPNMIDELYSKLTDMFGGY